MLIPLKRFVADEHGQGMAEYGLIIALVAVVVILALTMLGTNISAKFDKVASEIGK